MQLSWSGPASGDYDTFQLQWSPPDPLSVTQLGLQGRLLTGLFPGRRYNLSLITVSGGGAKPPPTTTSLPIHSSVRTSRLQSSQAATRGQRCTAFISYCLNFIRESGNSPSSNPSPSFGHLLSYLLFILILLFLRPRPSEGPSLLPALLLLHLLLLVSSPLRL